MHGACLRTLEPHYSPRYTATGWHVDSRPDTANLSASFFCYNGGYILTCGHSALNNMYWIPVINKYMVVNKAGPDYILILLP